MKLNGLVKIEVSLENKLSLDHLKNYIASSLIQEEAQSVEARNNNIDFKVGIFRPFSRTAILAPISSGTIEMNSEEHFIHVKYTLSFNYVLIFATLMISVILFFDFNNYMADSNKLLFLIFGWAFLVFGNIITTGIRFPGFIKECASKARKITYIK